jgi:prolyl-tRNA synthetase
MTAKYPDRDSIAKLLADENIPNLITDHEPLLTIPPAIEHFTKNPPAVEAPYIYCKNLFLKNKQGGLYLITAAHDTKTDYKTLCKIFKAKKDSIREADKDKLPLYLHVEPGHVNSFSLLNLTDEQRKEVQFHLDKNLVDNYKTIGIPPMNSSSTCWIKPDDLIKLLEKNGFKVNVTDFTEVKLEEKKEEKDDKKKEKKEKPDKKEKKDKAEKKDKKGKKDENIDEDISSLGIQNKKEENFSDWYSECITKSEMIDYYDISGCYILRPWSYEIWEKIQSYLDALIKKIGVRNYNFPLFVSQKALFKEKEHVEGFSPEVAWVTKSGKGDIDPPIAIRPTSETIMYPAFAKWIRSHRDLPLLANQWTNIVRWEFKNPTPFIRTREFLWQEGHTVHETFEEAEKMVYTILDYYRMVYEDLCACPVIPGIKSENEKFPGGFCTTSIEGLLPNGKAVQCATSHHLGQNFSKMFEITFLDKEKKKQTAWQTSWGLTTRTIGVLVMMHGDNKGLVLPPKVAPTQVVIVPIKTSKDNAEEILGKGKEIYEQLKNADIRVIFDDSEMHTPGWKYAEWELKGVPIRIEYGKKDLSKDQVTFFCRDNLEKFPVKLTEVVDKIKETLEVIQKRMFEKQLERVKNSTTQATDFDKFLEGLNKGNIIYTPWCKDSDCEDKVKEKVKEIAAKSEEQDTVGTCKTLNMPLDQPKLEEGTKCFFCGKPAKATAIWGRSY